MTPMQSDHFILVLAQKSLKSLKPRIAELDGFYNQLGYAFPSHRKKEVEALFRDFDPKKLKIIEQPLTSPSFSAYAQSHKVDFTRRALLAKKMELGQAQSSFSTSASSEEEALAESHLSEGERELLLRLLHEEEALKEQLAWAEAMEKTSLAPSRKIDLHFLSSLKENYLETDAPQKERLIYWTDPMGVKHAFLPKGIVAMIVGAGGVGKTHLIAHLALCVATGVPFLGNFEIERPGAVCMVLGENKMDDIHRLLRKTAKNMKRMLEENKKRPEYRQFALFDPNPLNGAPERLCISTVHGVNSHFLREGRPTDFYSHFLEGLKQNQPKEGWSLIILDPISRFAGLDAEKDNAIATDFIALLERMSEELTGHPTVLISHHKPKPSVSN
ncbi:MAG: AAA family ATPase, partial [Chlamydiota bacterium]